MRNASRSFWFWLFRLDHDFYRGIRSTLTALLACFGIAIMIASIVLAITLNWILIAAFPIGLLTFLYAYWLEYIKK